MARTKIKVEKPSWFGLDKYSGLRKADMGQLAQYLFARFWILRQIELYEHSEGEEKDSWARYLDPLLDRLFDNPLDPELGGISGPVLAVKPLTALDAAAALHGVVDPEPIPLEMHALACHRLTYSRDSRTPYDLVAYISIDLSMPKEQIKKEFQEWLSQKVPAKKSTRTSKRVPHSLDNLKASIMMHNVLPYIDLAMIWARYPKPVKLTIPLLADWIFPSSAEGSETEDIIRKSTKPLADQVTQFEVIRRLSGATPA